MLNIVYNLFKKKKILQVPVYDINIYVQTCYMYILLQFALLSATLCISSCLNSAGHH